MTYSGSNLILAIPLIKVEISHNKTNNDKTFKYHTIDVKSSKDAIQKLVPSQKG